MLERDIERKLGEQLRGLGCLYYKFVSPGQCGVPDRIVVCPDGSLWFVELKRPQGKLGALQSVQLARLTRYGQRTALIWDEEAVLDFVHLVKARHCKRCAPSTALLVWKAGDQK